jgi:hypothetical protein
VTDGFAQKRQLFSLKQQNGINIEPSFVGVLIWIIEQRMVAFFYPGLTSNGFPV